MKLPVKFTTTDQTFDAAFSDATAKVIPASFGEVQVVTERVDPSLQYEGSYTVTPKVDAQTLPTAKKYMEQDVTVLAIPVYRTTNTADGTTVYIAKEVQ